MVAKPLIAVVVVAWQNIPELDDCFASLAEQTDNDFSVVVADNGAGLGERVSSWEDRLNILHLDLERNHGPSFARNRAVEACEDDLVLFLDDDATAAPDWVAVYRELFSSNESVVAARGRVAGKTDSILNELARAYDLGEERMPAILNTEGNCGIRRSAFERVGGFATEMFGHEGAELSARLIADSGDESAIVYEPDAIIYHDYVESFGAYLQKRYRTGLMVEHLSMETLRNSALRSRRRSKWTPTRLALVPVKAVGVGAEAAGAIRGKAA